MKLNDRAIQNEVQKYIEMGKADYKKDLKLRIAQHIPRKQARIRAFAIHFGKIHAIAEKIIKNTSQS